ncbi:unnamed protein product [Dracunculus medinensis]|uniref:Neur_chan_LBD domain-containing protein n=1 Tax=Dracunculus medinensis TaxID=318479 RepID=A0A0N4U262_DRAME|nr:unnamed protein product [Dracunculus medinensis]
MESLQDERSQVLTLNVWVEQTWRDERISWDPQDYGNISKLTVGTQHLWIPDIVLYNNARDFSRGFVNTNVHVLQWAPPVKIYSICELDVTYFPFDDQFCSLEFGSCKLDVQILERHGEKAPFTKDSFIENGEWEIVANRTRKVLKGRHSLFPTIIFELHLRRRVLYFLYNIIVPCVMLSLLTMMQFILPCESGEKITLGLTVLLAYSVFTIYLMGIMFISGLSVCLSVIVLNIRHGAERGYKPPKWLKFIAYRILSRLFCNATILSKRKLIQKESPRDLLSRILLEHIEAEQNQGELVQQWREMYNCYTPFACTTE